MSGNANQELIQAVADINSADDVVDLLVVLLKICRLHAEEVLAAGQDLTKRAQMRQEAGRAQQAASAFTSRVLSAATKQLVINGLQQATDFAVAARAWALGIDLAMGPGTKVYSQLCAKPPNVIRILKEGDPYPTPSVDLSSMYGANVGFSRKPRRNAATAFDRVGGLALWPSASSQPLKVIYDTVAGAYLDRALVQRDTVDILAVVPNQDFWSEFNVTMQPDQTFFDVQPKHTADQDTTLRAALQLASDHDVDIVVTPELSDTKNTVALIKAALTQNGGGRPRVVIAGGSHIVTGTGERRNRMSTIYADLNLPEVTHDKIGEFVFTTKDRQTKRLVEWDEGIHRSTELRIHAGITWSMITLICADLLDDTVVDAVADLCPRLVIVPSMSAKTGDYEMSMGAVIRKSQALVMVVNGPPEWTDPPDPLQPLAKPPLRAIAPVVIVGMPLAKAWITTLSMPAPPPSAGPPYTVLFRSDQCQVSFV
ncbi:MAG TPA: hypothetical protein VE400_01375 [Mycobacterium sp.]|nr:hypothetical protein [Mycobacterium sp.]